MTTPLIDQEKAQCEAKALQSLKQTRSRLILSSDATITFFSTLAMRLEWKVDWRIPTAYVDGKHLGYNPDFINLLTAAQLKGLLVHEILHLALSHHTRKGNREPSRFNVAADLAINDIVMDAGLELPPNGCFVGKPPFEKFPKGLSAEEYYNMLPIQEGGYGSTFGEIKEPGDGSEADKAESEGDWKVAVSQAHNAAKQMGKMSAGMERIVDEIMKSKVDYREILRQFLSTHAKNDYSWRKQNRRFVHQGIYLPSLYSEELGDIAVAIDTSGSIGAEELRVFAGELEAILGCYSCKVNIIYFDAALHNEHEWETSDGPLILQPKGGGGTDFRPIFSWIENHEKQFVCLIVLTDLYGSFPSKTPEIPTLWVINGNKTPVAPFGTVVCT